MVAHRLMDVTCRIESDVPNGKETSVKVEVSMRRSMLVLTGHLALLFNPASNCTEQFRGFRSEPVDTLIITTEPAADIGDSVNLELSSSLLHAFGTC